MAKKFASIIIIRSKRGQLPSQNTFKHPFQYCSKQRPNIGKKPAITYAIGFIRI
jgi:hypothetical protein